MDWGAFPAMDEVSPDEADLAEKRVFCRLEVVLQEALWVR